MIIAHLADVHLGYRAYSRVTPAGVNQREADVAAAFGTTIEKLCAIRPDLIVVAGDLFHNIRPSNGAIADAFRQVAALVRSLPDSRIVLVAGDRDTPRSADTAPILDLFREIDRVFVATDRTERIEVEALRLEVVAVPHAVVAQGRGALPGPRRAGWARVLVTHGLITGERWGGQLRAGFAEGGATIPETALEPGEWDYVALGHYPLPVEIAPHVRYSGSIERTSSDLWREASEPKGFLTWDTESRAATFHVVPGRRFVDLPRISARELTGDEVERAIAAAAGTADGGLADSVARLVITDLPRSELRGLDAGVLRKLRAEALHFLLDARAPRRSPVATGLPVRGVTLEQQVEEYLGRVWSPTMDGIEREQLLALGLEYLGEAARETGS